MAKDKKEPYERRWKPKNEGKTLLGGLNLTACKQGTECAAAIPDENLPFEPGNSANYARTVTNPCSLLKKERK